MAAARWGSNGNLYYFRRVFVQMTPLLLFIHLNWLNRNVGYSAKKEAAKWRPQERYTRYKNHEIYGLVCSIDLVYRLPVDSKVQYMCSSKLPAGQFKTSHESIRDLLPWHSLAIRDYRITSICSQTRTFSSPDELIDR